MISRHGCEFLGRLVHTNRFKPALIAGMLSLVGGACIGPAQSATEVQVVELHFAVEPYGSVEQLAGQADLIILGTVGPIIAAEADRGGDPEVDPVTGSRIQGIPMAFAEVSVDMVVAGGDPGSTIAVGFLDETRAVSEDSSPLLEGQRVVLFLEYRDRLSAPGITVLEEHWVPISGDNGVLDIVAGGSRVSARSSLLTDVFGQGSPSLKPRLDAPLADVLSGARSSS